MGMAGNKINGKKIYILKLFRGIFIINSVCVLHFYFLSDSLVYDMIWVWYIHAYMPVYYIIIIHLLFNVFNFQPTLIENFENSLIPNDVILPPEHPEHQDLMLMRKRCFELYVNMLRYASPQHNLLTEYK